MTTPSSFLFPIRIVTLADTFLACVRTGADDQGQPVERHLARGGAALRGERR